MVAPTPLHRSRTDMVLAMIERLLRSRSEEIDGDEDLTSLGITVKMNSKTGQPFRVLYRPETEIDAA